MKRKMKSSLGIFKASILSAVVIIPITSINQYGPLFLISNAQEQENTNNNSIMIHGGGMGTVVCPDGSSVQTDIAFIAISLDKNGKVSGNWTLDDFGDPNLSGTVSTQGPIYTGNLITINNYNLSGETRNPQEKIRLCNPPLFAPISFIGTCGTNVIITVALQSEELFNIVNTFQGTVNCQYVNSSLTKSGT